MAKPTGQAENRRTVEAEVWCNKFNDLVDDWIRRTNRVRKRTALLRAAAAWEATLNALDCAMGKAAVRFAEDEDDGDGIYQFGDGSVLYASGENRWWAPRPTRSESFSSDESDEG